MPAAAYVRSIMDPDLDINSELFQVLAVTNHMIRHKNTPEEMVKLQLLFMSGEKHWYPIDVILMESPMVIVEYVLRNHLVSQRHFKWIVSFCNDNDFNKFVKPILFRVAPNQRTDMHDILPENMPPPPDSFTANSITLFPSTCSCHMILIPLIGSNHIMTSYISNCEFPQYT
eukprot:scaffold395719_cov83-Attheya_sp.AAC.2